MSRLIPCPPGTPFVPFLRDIILDAVRDNKRTRVILPAGDVCRLARQATEHHKRVLIYSLDEAAGLFGKDAPLRRLKTLSPACGRFLVNAFLEKAGAADGEKAAPRFYRLLSETERLFGNPARLADAAEASGFHEQCSQGAALFLMLCRHWNAVVTEAGYISPAAKRAARVGYWLTQTPPDPARERLVAAYMPVADYAVQTVCRFIADTDDGIIFTQGCVFNDPTHAPDHPDHYAAAALAMIETAEWHIADAQKTLHPAAPLWFAPATALPAILSGDIPSTLPEARLYPDIMAEQEANAARLHHVATAGSTAALVTQDAHAAAAVASILRGKNISYSSALELPPELIRFHACLDACFAYAAPRHNAGTAALLQLCRAPFSDIDEETRRRAIALAKTIIANAAGDAGAEAINDIPALLRAPAWPVDAEAETALWQRLHDAIKPLKQAAYGTGSPAHIWHTSFVHMLPLITDNIPEQEEKTRKIPSPEDVTAFMCAPGLGTLPLSAERALSLLKEACIACFPTPDIALTPGIPLICRAEHVRLLEPELLIFSGLTEDGFDRSDTDAYLGKLPEDAALLSAEARIARRSAELLAGLSAGNAVYTCARTRAGSALRPSRAMARLLLLHKAANTVYSPFIPEREPCAKDAPPHIVPLSALRAYASSRPFYATALEKAFVNPYVFYAKYILHLREANHDHDDKPRAEFGNLLHEAAEHYYRQHDHGYNDPYLFKRCVMQAAENRRRRLGSATIRAFAAAACAMEDAFLHDNARYHADYPQAATEVTHSITVPYGNGASITIKARLDRCATDDSRTHVLITDIKTGTPPSKINMLNGKSAQLPLQALTVTTAFPEAEKTLRAIAYKADGVCNDVTLNAQECAEVITNARAAVTDMANYFFARTDTAFPFTREIPYGDAYHHLARYDGWRYDSER